MARGVIPPSKKKSKVPWGTISVGVGIAVVLLAVYATFTEPAVRPAASGERRSQRPGDAGNVMSVDQATLAEYERIIKSAEEHVNLGATGYETAKQLFDQAIALIPDHPLAFFNLARVSPSHPPVFPRVFVVFCSFLTLVAVGRAGRPRAGAGHIREDAQPDPPEHARGAQDRAHQHCARSHERREYHRLHRALEEGGPSVHV